VDIVEEKLEMAKQLGADEVINAREDDPVARVKKLTEGRGADVSFEIIGLPETITQAIDSVRPGGTIMDIGSIMEPFTISMVPFVDYGLAMSRELTLKTVSHCSRADMTKLVALMGHTKIDFELGTEKVALGDINQGFETKRESDKFRVVIMPEW
jgi:L-iditol 2-dehydrogenase